MAPRIGLPAWFSEPGRDFPDEPRRRRAGGFLDKNLRAVTGFARGVYASEEYAVKEGLLQSLEPGMRGAGVLALVFSGALSGRYAFLASLTGVVFALAFLSGVGPTALLKRMLPPLAFTAFIVWPVFLSPVSPGEPLLGPFIRPWGVEVSITREGVLTGLFFLTRVTAMVAPVSLLFLTTRQADLYRGLGRLPVPAFFVTALFMTFRYIFILVKLAEDSTLARKSRTIFEGRATELRGWLASRMAFLLRRSLSTAEEVSMAMASRGFAGKVRTFGPGPLRVRDYLWAGGASFALFLSFAF